jgi:hypothetical protein
VGKGDAAVTQGAEEAPGRGRPADGSDAGPRPDGRRGSARPGRAAAIGAAAAVGAALLFLGYLRVSWTVAATSDGAAEALQARDMLAGNWLLHGWTIGDVSFYTTELPEYVLVEVIRPFGLGVIHIAAAATYTMLVLAVFALAYGRSNLSRSAEGAAVSAASSRGGVWGGYALPCAGGAGGRGERGAGAPRAGRLSPLGGALLATVIMLAPQLGYGAFVLLLSPDHIGTELPLLLGWLLLDLAPRRWWVPAIMCLLLAAVQFADRVALLTAVLPLILVCTVTAARRRPRLPGQSASGLAGWAQARWFELALVAAAGASVGVSWAAARLLAAAGGFVAHPFSLTLAPLSQLWTHTWLTGWGILEVYGGNFIGVAGRAGITFAVLHLIGLTLAVVAVAVALVRFVRPRRPEASGKAELVDSVLAVAVIANLVSYLLSTAPGTVIGTGYDAREIAAVLPLGAVLAGRVFGKALAGRVLASLPGRPPGRSQLAGRAKATVRSRTSILISCLILLVIAGYMSAFGYSAAQAAAPGQESALAGWLVAHGLRYGLGQSSANVVTVETGARVEVAPVTVAGGRVRALLYQSPAAAYDPRLHDADFLVTRVPPAQSGEAVETVPYAAVRATFGPPARTYRFDGYTVLVWNVNLLTRMAR